ncbi:Ankyrin-2 [Dactylella cylindrospora]|nr:Ankyrin-2 [Dactylella cylindrospora]
METCRLYFAPVPPARAKLSWHPLWSIIYEHFPCRMIACMCVAYVYFNYKRGEEQTVENIFRSLLRQLARGLPSIPEIVKELYDGYAKVNMRPPLNQISTTLSMVAALYPRILVVVDALDECRCQEVFLSNIFDFQAETGATLFATSRDIPGIQSKFAEDLNLEICAKEDDVREYLRSGLPAILGLIGGDNFILGEIEDEIVKSVDGMFLLAKLRLNSLKGMTSPKQIRKALEVALKVSATDHAIAYNDAYDKTMEIIRGQLAGFRALAEKALAWVIQAKRPLTIIELQYCLAVEPATAELDPSNISPEDLIVNICGGLMVIDNRSHIVRLIHHTAQEYFERSWYEWFPEAFDYMTETCITFLSYSTFKTETGETISDLLRQGNPHPLRHLFVYIAANWGDYARKSSTEGGDLTLKFLGDEALEVNMPIWFWATSSRMGFDPFGSLLPRRMRGIHLAAYFGLSKSIASMITNNVNIEAKDWQGRTALSWAATYNRGSAVKVLIDRGAKLEARDENGWTALFWASMSATSDSATALKLLIEGGANLRARDKSKRTVLFTLAEEASNKSVGLKILIKSGADLEARDRNGRTALFMCHVYNSQEPEKALIEMGANLEARDINGQTALLWAIGQGWYERAKLLIDAGADLNARDNQNRTPLVTAIRFYRSDNIRMVKLLVESGADLEVKCIDGRTALLEAVTLQSHQNLKLLIEAGANLEAKDDTGRTALLKAAALENYEKAKMLIEAGADLEVKCANGRKALLEAVALQNYKTAKLLIEVGANLEAKDDTGRTALLYALATGEKGQRRIVKLLATSGADPRAKDNSGKAALQWPGLWEIGIRCTW